jgi:hypothetical protein
MFLKVVASMAPVSGALFAGGTLTDCADEDCGRPHCDAMTMPTAAEAMAIRTA